MSTYQAASGAGQEGMDELFNGAKQVWVCVFASLSRSLSHSLSVCPSHTLSRILSLSLSRILSLSLSLSLPVCLIPLFSFSLSLTHTLRRALPRSLR